MIGCNAAEVAMLLTCLDRLVCVAKPVVYRRIPCAVALPMYILLSVGFGVWANYASYQSIQLMRHNLTVCTLASCYGEAMASIIGANGLMNLAMMGIYGLIWLTVKKISKKRASGMLRSIGAVTFCVVGGWLLTMVLFKVFLALEIPIPDGLILYFGLFLNISIALNYPIYFFMSTQYRAAFKEQLNYLCCRAIFRTTIHGVSNHSQITQTNKTRQTQYSSNEG
ncbi:unnamed protein product [Bursaphelenchus xylophilus]|uniref:(pine wood nematode) hypothetical protein n=1 Tax=Bursaphelenchus xylophilus TaxID=6326 RepID=A0A1I7SUV2_BURXY|nr:unnamed protein product [Bursaphelenchus xylophilus]CAG9125859.1 unnamed protein product [Bursaphelenchus xylophilus]